MEKRLKKSVFRGVIIFILLFVISFLLFSYLNSLRGGENKKKSIAKKGLEAKKSLRKESLHALSSQPSQSELKSKEKSSNSRLPEKVFEKFIPYKKVNLSNPSELDKPLVGKMRAKILSYKTQTQTLTLKVDYFRGFEPSFQEKNDKRKLYFFPRGTVVESSLFLKAKNEASLKKGENILARARILPLGKGRVKVIIMSFQVLRS